MENISVWIFFVQFYSVISSQQLKCNPPEEICKDVCYDTQKFDCLENGVLCPKGEKFCHARYDMPECFNPSSHHCINRATICLLHENECNGICYSPENNTCVDTDYEPILCNIGEEHCAGQCFMYTGEPGGKVCSEDGKALCNPGEKNCDFQCYSPETARCLGNDISCKAGEELCGYECYDPNRGTCFNNTKICLSTRVACGDNLCYWPHNETCYSDRKPYHDVACANKLTPCGNECFAAGRQLNCLKDDSNGIEILCPITTSKICGHTCYTPSDDNKCVKGLVCKKDEEACEKKCYDPKSLGKNMGCYKKEKVIRNIPGRPGTVIEFDVLECDPGYEMNAIEDCHKIGETETSAGTTVFLSPASVEICLFILRGLLSALRH